MPIRRTPSALAAAGVLTLAVSASVALWAELVDLRASCRRLGDDTAVDRRGADSLAVIVLGYRNRGERANFVNRFRVRAGIRSLDPAASTSLLVLCGGAVGGETPEAIVMQKYARDELGFRGAIALDPDSRSTWENIANAVPHIDRADAIKIVSNAPHAEMGREILWQQRPDLAARLVRGEEHRFGEAPVLKILSALRIVHSRLTGSRVSRARAPR